MTNSSHSLPPLPDTCQVTVQFDAVQEAAFQQMLNEFHFGKRYQTQVNARAKDRAHSVESLKRLLDYALRERCGSSRVIATFLASLYNRCYKFDLIELRLLDDAWFQRCIDVLYLDHRPEKEVHRYFDDGGALWEKMIDAYGLAENTRARTVATSMRSV